MAHIEKRTSGRYRARLRGPDGRERSRTFARVVDARAWIATQTADIARGQWIDPAAGAITFGEFGEQWLTSRAGTIRTRESRDIRWRLYVAPTFADRPLGAIRTSEIDAWLADLTRQGLAPNTILGALQLVSGVFRAALRDRLVGWSPVADAQKPKVQRTDFVALTAAQVRLLAEAVPDRMTAAVWCAAGLGMRQGEVLGLMADRIDFLRRQVRIDRQLISPRHGDPFLAPPKSAQSVRTVPLPEVVSHALAEHLRLFPPVEQRVFSAARGGPWRRTTFGWAWTNARTVEGVPSSVRFHDLRHFYASTLIEAGESVKVIQARLGHSSALTTLDTYGHLFPESEERTRKAVDAAFSTESRPIRGLGETPRTQNPS